MRQQILDPMLTSWDINPDTAREYGEVFTRGWIVDMILDLAGYDEHQDLTQVRAVEPACGTGAFLQRMVLRLSASCRRHGRSLAEAASALVALDLLTRNVETSRRTVEKTLLADGWPLDEATAAAQAWVHQGDYLLGKWSDESADFVLGNPPYIRIEDVPPSRMSAYRAACPTMVGRSDIYVGFFEVALRSLRPNGVLGFICADRWMRNQYGSGLRHVIASEYSVEAVITMHDVDAFLEQVSAYPAITVIRNDKQGSAVVAEAQRSFGPAEASALTAWARRQDAPATSNKHFAAARMSRWFDGKDSWPTGSPARIALIENLNDRFSPLESKATGTKVGIGVATGADGIFVRKNANVEPDRLLPLSMVRDTTSGTLTWSGWHLVNPWNSAGQLIDLADYPLLRKYFSRHAEALHRRHVAGKQPNNWFRTIDKIDHSLTARPKLLLPDMKMNIHPVLDRGGYYPHHNLYYIVSDRWDLRVLGGLLLSGVAQAFIEAYAVRMRGGTLRFQAQYLRRIRVPNPDAIDPEDGALLADAFDRRDSAAATDAALRVYGIDQSWGDLVSGSGEVRSRHS
jgi:adenine-specific DNA-methyltransferase